MANIEFGQRHAVVFGANGSLGREVTRQLAKMCIPTKAVVREGKEEQVEKGATPFGIDFDDIGDITGVLQGASEIYYAIGNVNQGVPSLRSRAYLEALDANTILPLTIRENAEDGARFVYGSSIAVYGDQGGNLFEGSQKRGEGIYAETKKQAEEGLMDRHAGPPTTIVRPASIFGPGADVWSDAVYTMSRRKVFPADGKGRMPVVDIRDVAKAMIRSVEVESAEYAIYNLAADETPTVADIANYYKILTRVTPIFLHAGVTDALGRVLDLYSKKTGNAVLATSESLHNLNNPTRRIDNTRAKKELGMEFTPVLRTMRDSLLWINRAHHLKKEQVILEAFSPIIKETSKGNK